MRYTSNSFVEQFIQRKSEYKGFNPNSLYFNYLYILDEYLDYIDKQSVPAFLDKVFKYAKIKGILDMEEIIKLIEKSKFINSLKQKEQIDFEREQQKEKYDLWQTMTTNLEKERKKALRKLKKTIVEKV